MSRQHRLRLERLDDRVAPAAGLDSTFNLTGINAVNFGLGSDTPVALDISSDNKVVLFARTDSPTDRLVLARFNPSGTLDTTFGSKGIARFDFGSEGEFATAEDVEVLADGSVLVLANSFSEDFTLRGFGVLKFTSAGQRDAGFGTTGVAAIVPPDGVTASGAALADAGGGAFFVGGTYSATDNSDLLAVRFTAAGAPDPTFGTKGVATTGFDLSDTGSEIVGLPDGKVVVFGLTGGAAPVASFDLAIARFAADGTLDPTFDGDGEATPDIGADVFQLAAGVLPDGDLFVAVSRVVGDSVFATFDAADGAPVAKTDIAIRPLGGEIAAAATPTGQVVIAGASDPANLVIARVNAGGTPDAAFGTKGFATVSFASARRAAEAAVGVRADGKVVAATQVNGVVSGDATLVRLNTNGSADATFGTNGKTTLPNQGQSFDRGDVALPLAEGRVLTVGSTSGTDYQLLALARFLADGTLDPAFDGDGKLTLNVGTSFSATGAVLQPDGRFVVAGVADGKQAYAVRLNANGTFDNTFGGDGKVELAPATAEFLRVGVALAPDGGLVFLAASAADGSLLLRTTAAGAPDVAFSTDGKVAVDLGDDPASAGFVTVASDGAILVSGTGGGKPAIARYLANGSPDTTFGTAGVVTLGDTGEVGEPVALADGRVLSLVSDGTALRLTRRLIDGSADAAFGDAGFVEFDAAPAAGDLGRLFVLADGSYLVASGPQLSMFRFNEDGSVDLSFSIGGTATVDLGDLPARYENLAITFDDRLIYTDATAQGDLAVARIVTGALTVTIALDPASDTGISNIDGVTSDTTPTFTGTATPGTTVELFVGLTSLGITTVGEAGTWAITTTALADGTYEVFATPTDADENSSTSANVTVVIDATAPTLTISQASGVNPADRSVTFTLRFNQDVTGLTIDEITVGGVAGGTVTSLVGSGSEYTVRVTGLTRSGVLSLAVPAGAATDAAGNASSAGAFQTTVSLGGTVRIGGPDYFVGSGAGGAPTVQQIDGTTGTILRSYTPFDATYLGGVRVAGADVNNDGVDDVFAGTGPGVATLVRVLDGESGDVRFAVNPFESSFTGGVYVAAGDIDGDGFADLVVTPDEGGGPRVQIISGKTGQPLRNDFFGIEDESFRGGARATLADVNGDGVLDLIVAAGFGGGPRVAVFDGVSLLSNGTPVKIISDFFVFEQTLRNGAFVTGGDIDGDGFAEVIAGGGPGGGPRVFALNGQSLSNGGELVTAANFFAGDSSDRGGVRLAVKNVDDDNRADLITGAGDGSGSATNVYPGVGIEPTGVPALSESLDAFPGFANGVYVG